MQPLSAIDAISPAWDHTRKLLFSPLRWQTLLKIGLVAAFAGAGGSGFNYNNFNGFNPGSSHGSGTTPHWPAMHLPAIAAMASIVAIVCVVVLIIWFAFFYLASRLQFVLFDVVLRRDTTIGPIWSRYGAATWRWMGLKLLLSLASLILILPVLIPVILSFIHAFKNANGQPNFGLLLAGFFASFAILLLVALVTGICSLLLYCFGLPSMALEGTPLHVTVTRVIRLVRAEPLQVFLFILMRIVLAIVAAICVAIPFVIGALILAIPIGGIGGVLWMTMHSGPASVKAVMWFGIVLLAVVYLVIFFAVSFMCSGVTGTFFQAYALYFLGGRYPLLGEILQPLPPQPPLPYFYPPPQPAVP
jgi:hypothetical protein